jgi:DNA-binding MarR family transcriptional regulator
MTGGGQALFGFVRFWSRRWTGVGLGVDAERGQDVMVLEAVHAVAGAQPAVAVNDIARELGVDQSGASRMVQRAERLGLLTRQRSGRIGTPASIALTASGERVLHQAHAWQDDVLRTLTADWPADDVSTLVVLMDRLVAAQAGLDAARRKGKAAQVAAGHTDPHETG